MNTDYPQKHIDRITAFIKTTFSNTGFSSAVIGVSGGIDSAVSLALTTLALGKDHVFPILLPYGSLNTQGVLDGMLLVESLGLPLTHVQRIDVKPMVDVCSGKEFSMDHVRKGNIIARTRMIQLFDQAKKRNALVVGTENKSERLLGYFTRFGDAASDMEPITHLYKTEVYALATTLHIPSTIINNAPSAGLWPEQTDEKELGFSYTEADPILEKLVDEKKTLEEIIALGFEKTLVEHISRQVEKISLNKKHHTHSFREYLKLKTQPAASRRKL